MLTKHVTDKLEAYLDHRLSTRERHRVEEHLATCPFCAHRLFEAQRLANELGPVMKKALSQPVPPPGLRHQVRQALKFEQESRRLSTMWAASGRLLNAAGTIAVVTALVAGAFVVIQGQLPANEVERSQPIDTSSDVSVSLTQTPVPLASPSATRVSMPSLTSLRDRLSEPNIGPMPATDAFSGAPSTAQIELGNVAAGQHRVGQTTSPQITSPKRPGGTIAFSAFDLGLQNYRIHLIDSDGTNQRKFPLDRVSEPALRRAEDGSYRIAYRGWDKSMTSRALVVSSMRAEQETQLTHFLEDAQPDWSPTENRIIFASQRESDRRWRLYTIWADGTNERNLRREGRSPTFAPDGQRFAFESCDSYVTKKQCGLWIGDLGNSEYGSKPFLQDPLAKAPDWSPNSEEIAFMANADGNWDLHVVNTDGSNRRQLTSDPAVDGLPTWSPDGKWLAFISNRNGHWGIWLLHVATEQVKEIYALPDETTFSLPQQFSNNQRNWWDEQLSWSH